MTRRDATGPFGTPTIPGRLADPELPAQLREQFSDRAAAFLKAVVGELPAGGGLVAELIGRIIPNQREDRLYAFIADLAREVEATGQTLEQLLGKIDAEKAALFEDGVAGAVKATTAERIHQLVGLVAKGLGANGREAEDQRSIVRLLNDLSEADLRYVMGWIKKYNDDPEWRRANGFDVRFKDNFVDIDFGIRTVKMNQPIPVGDVMDNIAEMSIQGRLVSLGLFERRVIQAHDGENRRGDKFEYDVNVSDVGMDLLRRLDLIGPDDKRAHPWLV